MARLKNINRSKKHEDLVQRLTAEKHPETDKTLFTTIRELLCFAAMLGYAEKRRVSLDQKYGVEDVSYQQFEANDANDYIFIIALAETGSTDIFKADSKIDMVEIFEEYANGGIEIIKSWMNQYRDEFGSKAIVQGLFDKKYIENDKIDRDKLISSISF